MNHILFIFISDLLPLQCITELKGLKGQLLQQEYNPQHSSVGTEISPAAGAFWQVLPWSLDDILPNPDSDMDTITAMTTEGSGVGPSLLGWVLWRVQTLIQCLIRLHPDANPVPATDQPVQCSLQRIAIRNVTSEQTAQLTCASEPSHSLQPDQSGHLAYSQLKDFKDSA